MKKGNIFYSRVLLMVLMVIMVLPVNVMAASNSKISEAQEAWVKKNVKVDGDKIISPSASIKNYIILDLPSGADPNEYCSLNLSDGKTIYWLKEKDKSFIAAVSRSDGQKRVEEKMGSITETVVVNADIEGGGLIVSGAVPVVNLILGVGVNIIALFMGIYTMFDVFYLAFPTFRNKAEATRADGSNKLLTRTGKDGETKHRWITDEAVYAVQAGAENGKSPWGIYLRKRLVAHIMLGIVIYMLLTDNVHLITNIVLRGLAGLMNVLTSLGA